LFDLDQIIANLGDPARSAIVILDACCNDPFITRAAGAAAWIASPASSAIGASHKATMIAFANGAAQVAEDGDDLPSRYTGALGKYDVILDLEILDMFPKVRQELIAATHNTES
jgi:hypothetical protein